MTHNRSLTLMLAILGVASFLYLRDINRISFWEDESWMAVAVQDDLPTVWRFSAERGVHPPLYFYAGWFYTRLAGNSELALRWLSGIFALLGVAFTYRLGSDWYGRAAGTYAALLTTGSLFLIYFARLARHYTAFFALSVMLVWAYERWRKKPDSRAWLAIVVLLQTALVYTHYFGAWMAMVLGLHALIVLPRRDWLRLGVGLVTSAVLFLPWVPSIVTQLDSSGGGLGYATRTLNHALRAYLDRAFNGNYPFSFLLLLLGVVATWRWRKHQTGLFLALWLIVPLTLSLIVNTRFVWFIERNMIFTLGGVYILFGAGLAWVAEHRRGFTVAGLAAALFVVLGPLNYETYWPLVTPDWRSIADVVVRDSRPDDVFVVSGEPYSMTYYLRRFMDAPIDVQEQREWLAAEHTEARIWLTGSRGAVPFEAIDALSADLQQTRRYALGVLVTEFYQRAPDSTLTIFDDQIILGVSEPMDVLDVTPGQTLTLDLWWRALRQPDEDYSVALHLLAPDGTLVTQHDGGFDRGQVGAIGLPRVGWTPDARTLTLPPNLPPGTYDLRVSVYDWRTGERLMPEGGLEDKAYLLATVRVGA